jgi:YfiH family protein
MVEPENQINLPRLSFANFSGRIIHAVFARRGGVSPTPWKSLNVGFGVEDDAKNVLENRRRIKQALGITQLVSCKQVHGTKVRRVERFPDADIELESCDGLITDVPGVALMIQQADCQAVLLHDPVKEAVGIAHSGWRGSVGNIIGATIEAMVAAYHTRPEDLRAGIGPSLGPCCAEFVNYRTELPASLYSYQVRPNFFDFWTISRDQLVAAGVRRKNIEIACRCTVCCPELFSYRREGRTGRFAAVIGLR